MKTEELKEILDQFLNRWTIDNVKKMTLEEYVGIGNKDTFCQWVETKTRRLGSIKGLTSIKFGIYERKDLKKKPKNYQNDNKYSWLRDYGNDRKTVFEKVKRDIIKIIQLSELGRFDEIENIKLPDLFKWKVAFLYSNERLIGIFKRDVLHRIANHYGLTNKNIPIYAIQKLMMINKPAYLDGYEFQAELFRQFGSSEDQKEAKLFRDRKNKRTRKASSTRNTNTQIRTVTRSYVAEQRHNKIQESLKKILIAKYGKDKIILEENFVDIKLIQPDYISFFEVKSSSYASECIKEAFGQILLYSLNDKDKRPKKHIVVGQYPPTENDKEYIDFLKKNLKVDFDYINVEIE